MKRLLISLALTNLLCGCAIPLIQELRANAPDSDFIVHAPLGCLFDRGVERASSFTGLSEPKFTWHIDQDGSSAWFRQPLTLIEMLKRADDSTEIRRSRTPSAEAFGQGDRLIEYLKSNPCASPS